MSPRSLLVLLLLVLGLGLFIYFFERDLPSPEERTENAQRLLALEAEQIRTLEIHRGAEDAAPAVRLELAEASDPGGAEDEKVSAKDEDGWRLVLPDRTVAADTAVVSGLVTELLALEREHSVDDADLAALGLDPPRRRVVVETNLPGEGSRWELLLGRPLTVSNLVPARVSPPRDGTSLGTVHTVSDAILGQLDTPLEDWRERELLGAARFELEEVVLQAGDERLRLKVEDRVDSWWVEGPGGAWRDRADQTRADELLLEVTGLRAESFLAAADIAEIDLGLDPPRLRLEARVRGRASPVSLDLGGEAEGGGRYARRDGEVVTVQTGLAELFAPAEAWRSLDWTDLEAFQVDHLEIEAPQQGVEALALAREGGEWSRPDEDTAPSGVDAEAVQSLLYDLAEVRGERLLLQAPQVRPEASFTLRAGDRELALALAPSPAGWLATASDREAVLLLDAEVAGRVLDAAAALAEAPSGP